MDGVARGEPRRDTVHQTSGQLSAVYAGAAGHPAATVQLGSVTVDSWTPTVSLAGASPAVVKGTTVIYSGTLTRSGITGNMPGPG